MINDYTVMLEDVQPPDDMCFGDPNKNRSSRARRSVRLMAREPGCHEPMTSQGRDTVFIHDRS